MYLPIYVGSGLPCSHQVRINVISIFHCVPEHIRGTARLPAIYRCKPFGETPRTQTSKTFPHIPFSAYAHGICRRHASADSLSRRTADRIPTHKQYPAPRARNLRAPQLRHEIHSPLEKSLRVSLRSVSPRLCAGHRFPEHLLDLTYTVKAHKLKHYKRLLGVLGLERAAVVKLTRKRICRLRKAR